MTTPASTFDPRAPEDVLGRVQDTVKAWIRECTGINDVTWHNEPQGNISPVVKARVNLTMRNVVDSGQDEIRREADRMNNTQSVAQVGIRLVTVQIKVEAFTQLTSAFTILERIRSRSQGQRQNHGRLLKLGNISVNEMRQSINLPTFYDNRVISAAAADFVFNVASVLPSKPEDWVEDVNASGDVT